MEYNSEMKFKKPQNAQLRLKFLKIDMIRVSVLKEFISKNNRFTGGISFSKGNLSGFISTK